MVIRLGGGGVWGVGGLLVKTEMTMCPNRDTGLTLEYMYSLREEEV